MIYAFVFVSTRPENSISLVKAYWNELFTLGLAQCWQVMNVATILATFVNCLHGSLQQGKKPLTYYLFQDVGEAISFTKHYDLSGILMMVLVC